ncbi:MAG: hypothetical protein JSU04_19095 [Bdellovibrionales bacterium]|nr:hypothetical protein [Bdellovibrionales bacterium]
MQKLISYNANDKASFSLEADIHLTGPELVLEFSLKDPQGLFELPKTTAAWSRSQVARQDGLWQATCFEAFLQPSGQAKYYEFNFALNPAWNGYEFTAYREPQPPKATADFVLKAMSWNSEQKHLIVRFENKSGATKFQAGLTAILQEKSGIKHYYAVAHKGPKPDFHLSESFILQRGS